MTSAIDRPAAARFGLAGRPVPRSEFRAERHPSVEAPVHATTPVVETVTLGKIGDFLEIDFRRLSVWLRHGFWSMLVLAVLGAAAGAAYAILTPPQYTVSTELLIDPSNLQVVADDLYQAPGQIDSQVLTANSRYRVLTSGNVLARVVDELRLTEDKEFYDPTPGFLDSLLPSSGEDEEADPRVTALGALNKQVSSVADDKSFVATLMVKARTPEKAIRISDAVVGAFKAELANADADGAARTAEALNDRLNALKQSVKIAEEKVEGYKREHGLASSAGQLVSSQAMSQISTQVLDAQSRVIAAQSAYNELASAGRDISTSDTQESAALNSLRSRLTDLRQQANSQSVVYGPRHPSIVKLRTEIVAVETELDAEIKRIVDAARIALDEAKSSLTALTARADTLKSDVFSDNEALVTLRELERDSTSKSAIYEAFLQRARQVTEREQINTTNIRVISSAVPPSARSWPPRTVIVMGIGAVLGVVVAVLLAIVLGMRRDMRRDRHVAAAA